jgi:hypothetical protein
VELVSLSPFPALLLPWEADAGQASLTVVVKVTVQLLHDREAIIAETQLPIEGDRTWDDAPIASLYHPSDLAPLKPRTDLVLVGHAYAPGGKKVEQLVAQVKVGDFQKSITVQATRMWTAGPAGFAPGPLVPFERMPLRYERAGLSQDNPIGVDPAAPPSPGALVGPNLEPIAPATFACFAPIAAAWRPRRRLLGEAGRFWALAFETGGRSPEPAPRALDFRYFNVAPPDQQTSLLRHRAELELVNLSPTHPVLRTRLPALKPYVFRIEPRSRRPVEIALRCDTLWIDTDRAIACLVWRGLTDVPSTAPADIGTVLVVADHQGRRVRWEQAERAWREGVPIEATEPASEDALSMRHDKVRTKEAGAEPEGEREKDETRAFDAGTSGAFRPSLPFAEDAPRGAAPPETRTSFSERTIDPRQDRMSRAATPFGGVESVSSAGFSWSSALEDDSDEVIDDLDEATHTGSDDDTSDRDPDEAPMTALPFTSSGASPALPFTSSGASPALPFVPAAAPPLPAPRTPPPPALRTPPPPGPRTQPPPPSHRALPVPHTPPPPVLHTPPPPVPRAPPPPAVPRVMLNLPPPPVIRAQPAMVPAAAKPPAAEPPRTPEPPKLGRIALASPPAIKADPSAAAAIKPELPPPSGPAPSSSPASNPKDVPIALYGTISAELMIRRGERARVLDEHRLSEPAWARVHSHWTGEMGRETARGESKLLAQFDEAYVETMGRLRKPIGVPEYAALQVAIERGAVDKQLAALALSLSDLMRVQRVWTRRLADDPELGKVLGKAIEEARGAAPKG